MAVIELIFPQLKKDPESLKEALLKVPGVALAAFREAGVQRGLRGFINSEDGKDVTADVRELLVLEWPAASDFYAFVESPTFENFMAHMKPFADGPPELDLFETNTGSPLFGTKEFLEILLVRPKDASNGDEDIETVLEKVQSSLEKASDADTIYGSTVNLPQKMATIIKAFASSAERDAAKSSQQELLNEVGKLANLTRLEAEVKQLPI